MLIDNETEVDALPVGAVIREAGASCVAEKVAYPDGSTAWFSTGLVDGVTSAGLDYPVQLLHPRRYGAGEVEWVARVLYQEQRADIGCPIAWDETNEALRRRFRKRARAALNALEEK